jgi:basic membrane lipoprotein Med (substrate-binding protein (PBP1-ABC) superfamily)
MKRTTWKAVVALLAAAAFAGGVAACGDDDDDGGGGGGGQADAGNDKVKTAIVLPCATSDTWCKQGFDAAKKLEAEGQVDLEVTTNAPQDTAGVTRVLAQYAEGGTELLLAHSTWQDAAFDVAEQFPDVNIASYAFELKDNVAILEEPIYEGAYLAGMLAGGITESNTLGGSAGQDVPLCHAELEAFEAGAKRTNKQVKMIDTYIGDWNDAAKGKQATEAQIDQGADVVIACGGGPATGMAQAIKGTDVSGFGYVGNMDAQAPKNMVGSIIYNLEPYFEAAVKDVRSGTFRPAKRYEYGLADGGVDLQLNDGYSVKKIPADVMKQMEEVRAQIESGDFKVPYVDGT